LRATLLIALLAFVVAACAGAESATHDAGAPLSDLSAGVHLVVRNNSGGAVDVAIDRGPDVGPFLGDRRLGDGRVGLVAAGAVATFLLDDDTWDAGPVAVVATPVSGSGVARSAPFDVFVGDTIRFTIEPDLARSYTTVDAR
jgi:hypothetical protein